MTEIERKALALVNEIERQEGLSDLTPRIMRGLVMDEALCRAIEQHEAFKLEVSEAVEDYCGYVPPDSPCHPITRFIIAKPDPLVEAWEAMLRDSKPGDDRLEVFRAAIEARGGKIVWGK